jgi:hypothetical protein
LLCSLDFSYVIHWLEHRPPPRPVEPEEELPIVQAAHVQLDGEGIRVAPPGARWHERDD